ncbi:MAG: RNA polymerase sigma factor [Bacillota bacterium]
MDFTYLHHLSKGHDKNKILRDLMVAHGEDVWNFAFSLTRQRSLSDDIRQDVFMKAYDKLESFRGESSVKTLVLYAHYQLSIAEIANLLKISESAVKVRLHRARKKVNIVFQKRKG